MAEPADSGKSRWLLPTIRGSELATNQLFGKWWRRINQPSELDSASLLDQQHVGTAQEAFHAILKNDIDAYKRAIWTRSRIRQSWDIQKPQLPNLPLERDRLKYRALTLTRLVRERPPRRFLKVTNEDYTRARAAWEAGGVVAQIEGTRLTGRDLTCLRPGEWLNDEVMNAYMELLNMRVARKRKEWTDSASEWMQSLKVGPLRCYHWNTFFWASLTGETSAGTKEFSFQRVRRWTTRKKVNVFQQDLVMIPIHTQKIHWALGVIDLRSKFVFYFDSLGGSPEEMYFENVLRWLELEHEDKNGCPLPDKEMWFFAGNNFMLSCLCPDGPESDIPLQTNGSDCGVFVCQYAESLASGYFPFDFDADSINQRRIKMTVQILDGRLD